MSPFRFRLQRVLELREDAERLRAVELTDAQNQATAARETRRVFEEARSAGQAQLSSASNTGSSVGVLKQIQYVITALEERMQQATRSVVTAESLVSRAETGLRDAFMARHALDTLREKQAEAHRAAAQHRDRMLMDEIALTRFHDTDTTSTDPERSTNG